MMVVYVVMAVLPSEEFFGHVRLAEVFKTEHKDVAIEHMRVVLSTIEGTRLCLIEEYELIND